jgi:hypothetical protein
VIQAQKSPFLATGKSGITTLMQNTKSQYTTWEGFLAAERIDNNRATL